MFQALSRINMPLAYFSEITLYTNLLPEFEKEQRRESKPVEEKLLKNDGHFNMSVLLIHARERERKKI